jgi:glycosyltransferase involved in cell wall biosynthesis
LIVHFHGFDASQTRLLEEMAEDYRRMFGDAAALVAVSRVMRQRLIDLGAPAGKVHWNPYGVDCTAFGKADPAAVPPVFLAVGWFCDRKAPQLTMRAFARVHESYPAARLRMIGGGPLLAPCRELARELAVAEAVDFLGVQPPPVVQEEMRRARGFVQHSVVTAEGETEGTPVAILEAGASSLPVVATRHAGIPDAVLDGQTGFLVAEHDVAGMAEQMLRLAGDPALAGDMGRRARRWIEAEFSLPGRIGRLREIIQSCLPGAAARPPGRARWRLARDVT